MTQYEVRLVSALLEADPPALRFFEPAAPNCILEHDQYRYPQTRDGVAERENPLKVDDHTCNAVQYLVHGLNDWYGFGQTGMLGGHREAWDLPT